MDEVQVTVSPSPTGDRQWAGRPVPVQPVLPVVSSDETGEGWGDALDEQDDDARLLREVPPHHVG